ncbi:MAG: right-handed parallel beta-helix repeat-containing protein [Thermoguttaceae bacterium]|nr:right-handed parallel beta-helix repeat-containing protein [Thermoguttaceae bacterium]
MNRTFFLFLLLVVGVWSVPLETNAADSSRLKDQLDQATRKADVVLHVATSGNDAWSGLLVKPNAEGTDGPLRSLVGARDRLRKLRQDNHQSGKKYAVEVHAGVYSLSQSLQFGSEDSGTPEASVVWKAADGEEVRLVGGRYLDDFSPVTDEAIRQQLPAEVRDKVVQCNLKKAGVTDFGSPGGGGAELFFKNDPMRLSRYPNNDFMTITDLVREGTTEKIIRSTKGICEGYFMTDDPRPFTWGKEKDPWAYGFWYWDWATSAQKITSLDAATKTIRLAPPWHSYGYRLKQWFYAYNLLCEIDQPGEFYIDREDGILYFYPPSNVEPGTVLMSVLHQIVKLDRVSDFAFVGFLLEGCRSGALTVSGGKNVLVARCTVRNIGGTGITLEGTDHTVFGCHVYNVGQSALQISGGNVKTLVPGNVSAVNNTVHHFGRIQRVYSCGVSNRGVGNYIANNRIADAPHMGIFFSGNDHLMEKNEITNVCYESNDAGAIYAGRNWTSRGNLLKNNYLHDIKGFRDRGCVGMYLDDMFSTADMIGNLFVNVTRAAMIGGGRDIHIENNIFVDCVPAIHVDARALGWAHACGDGWLEEARKKGTLSGIKWKEPPYSTRYPKLLTILDGQPKAPEGNVIAHNICFGGSWDKNKGGGSSIEKKAAPFVDLHDNFIGDPLFVDAAKRDFRLRADSPAKKIGFEPIPFEKIGTYSHELAVPVAGK